MEASAYRRLKDAWFTNNTGSTMEEPFLAILPLAVLIFFAGVFQPKFGARVIEYFILIVPITTNLTIFANNLHELAGKTIALWLICCSFKFFTASTKLRAILGETCDNRPSWITNFRACTNLVTVICIFAVDLNIFPRKFAKTETYGFSLMDTGVGFYVMCHGLVYHKKKLSAELSDATVLGVLGVLRTISITALDYQIQVSEYGVHWNFFWTLCVCRFCSSILIRLFGSNAVLFIVSAIVHHYNLYSEVEKNVLSSTNRSTFIELNREGIVSLPGYLCLFFAAATYRDAIRGETYKNILKTTLKFLGALWVISYFMRDHEDVVSRRFCNIPYIIWILTMSLSFFFILILVDITLKWFERPSVPQLLEMVNRHAFLFFLIGNVCTGLINLRVQTLLLSSDESLYLLVAYEFTVIFLTYIINKKNYLAS